MSPTVRIGRHRVPRLSKPSRPSRFTVDELAQRIGLTPRTIRSYQTQGILHPPEHRGRVAYYDESHADRLEEIAELKEKGLSLAEIEDVFRRKRQEETPDRRPSPRPEPAGSPYRTDLEAGRASGSLPSGSAATTLRASPTGDVAADRPVRRGWISVVLLVVLLVALVAGSIFLFLSLSHADADRKRLNRELSDLRAEIARLPKEQAPPSTVVVPVPAQSPPGAAGPSTATTAVPATPSSPPAGPASRTIIVPSQPPATSPPTPTCTTLPVLNRCV